MSRRLTRSSLVAIGQAKVWLGTAGRLLTTTPTTANDPHVTDFSIQLTPLKLLWSFVLIAIVD